MKLTKNLIASAAIGSALVLGNMASAQEKKDQKPTPPPAAPAAPAAPAPGTPARPPARDRITAYAQYLKLTDEQKEKVRPILDDEIAQQQALRTDKALTPEARMAKMREIRDSVTAKVKPILTEEQVDKWMKMRNPRPAGAPGAPRPGAPAAPGSGAKAPAPGNPAPAAPAK